MKKILFKNVFFHQKKRSNSRKLKKTFLIPFLFIGVAFESKDGNQVSWEEEDEESQKHETSSCVINYIKTNTPSRPVPFFPFLQQNQTKIENLISKKLRSLFHECLWKYC